MRILAIDPGAERCGWAIMEGVTCKPWVVESGVMRCHRGDKEPFQEYRLRLEEHAAQYFDELLEHRKPDWVVNEVVPAVGGGNFVVATQSYLANCVATTFHNCAFKQGIDVNQISARTVQAKVGIKGRTGKVSKAGVRNGVVDKLPDLRKYVGDSAWPWDRWDAIAIGLASMSGTLLSM